MLTHFEQMLLSISLPQLIYLFSFTSNVLNLFKRLRGTVCSHTENQTQKKKAIVFVSLILQFILQNDSIHE